MTRTVFFRLMPLVLMLCVLNSADASADAEVLVPTVQWIRSFNADVAPAFEGVSDISALNEIYLVGSTDGTLPGQTSAGAADAYIRKYDIDGNQLWTRQFGTADDDWAVGVAAHPWGSYVVGISANQAFVYTFDTEGTIGWTRLFDTPEGTRAQDVFVDNAAVYVVGYTMGTLPGQTSGGSIDAFVRKYDLSGNEIWTRQFGTTNMDHAWGVTGDSSGIYIAGSTYGAFTDQVQSGGGDAFVRKFDLNGNELWTRQFGSSGDDHGTRITINNSGLYVVGSAGNVLAGQTYSGYTDSFIRKYDANGTEIWTRLYGTSNFDEASDVVINEDKIHVVGYVGERMPGDDSGSSDADLHIFNSDGNEVGSRQFGTSRDDGASSVCAIGSNLYIGGSTELAFPGEIDMNHAGAYLRKYDADSNEVWTRQFGASKSLPDATYAYRVASHQAVYVAGVTRATFPGQVNYGGQDVYLRKSDLEGNELWVRQLGSSEDDSVQALRVNDYDSSIYLAQDGHIRKFDSLSNELWDRAFGSDVIDLAPNIGGIYALGALGYITTTGQYLRSYNNDGIENWSVQIPAHERARAMDANSYGIYTLGQSNGSTYLRKYNNYGGIDWTSQIDGSSCWMFTEIAVRNEIFLNGQGNQGSCIVKYDIDGHMIWSKTFDVSRLTIAADINSFSAAWDDGNIHVNHYDFEGNLVWSTMFGTSEWDTVVDIAFDDTFNDESIYVTGQTSDGVLLAKLTMAAVDYDFLYLPIITDN